MSAALLCAAWAWPAPAGAAAPAGAGSSTEVAAVTFPGASALNPEEIVPTLHNKPGGRFSQDALLDDLLRIEKFYHDQGFLSASVRAPALTFSANRSKVTLAYPIAEGPRTPDGQTAAASTATTVAPSTAPAVAASTTSAPAAPEADLPPPWVIGDIDVKGTRNVKPYTVKTAIKAKVADLYDRPDMDRDRQAIYGLGMFDRVAVDIEATGKPVPSNLASVAGTSVAVRVSFIVEEKPIVSKISFEGRNKLSRGTLTDAISLKVGDPADSVKLREDVEKITVKYHEKGYLAAKTSYEVTQDTATWHVSVAFKIDEGPRSRIAQVTLLGAAQIKPKKALKELKNKRKKAFVESELPEDIKKIEAFYLKRGFLDVAVGSAAVRYSDDRTKIFIDIPVTEGRSYRFGETTFSGNIIYTSTQLVRGVEYRRGKVFDHEKYEETVKAIQEAYAEKGRLKMRVSPKKTLNPATDLMDIEYRISEGNIVYVDYVDVEGYKSTKRHVITREVLVKPGEAFSRSRLLASRDRILNLGFIDDVGVDFQESPTDPEKVGVIFDIVEGKPGLLTAGMAYSSTDGMMGTLSLSHLNLFGRAQRTSVQWQFGGRVNDYSISWTTPWIWDHPTSFGLDLFNTRRVQTFSVVNNAYVAKQTGGGFNIGPRFADGRYQLGLSYTFKHISYSNIDQRFRGVIPEASFNHSIVGLTAAYETRDNYWDPTRGARHAVTLSMSGGPFGGDVDIFMPGLSNAMHYRLLQVNDWPFVLSFYHRMLYITQFGSTKVVPVDQRFFIGGQDSLRGYSPDGEAGAPQGGRLRDIFNVEFGFPLAREKHKSIVKLVFFADAGNSWYDAKDVTLKVGSGLNQVKTDIGVGVRFVTPAFPIRLDYGYGFNHIPGQKKYQINFGIGNLF